jgi:hypothetical protein
MLLDRLLDRIALQVRPVAVCDVRKGVALELRTLDEPHLHCVLGGEGFLLIDGSATALAEQTLALVPANTAYRLEPNGGAQRALSVAPVTGSDHVPRIVAGAGEPGVSVLCARMRDAAPDDAVGLLAGLQEPVAADLYDDPSAGPLFAALVLEQQQRLPASRRMLELLLQQCVLLLLRRLLRDERQSELPWLDALRNTLPAGELQVPAPPTPTRTTRKPRSRKVR